MKLPSTLFFAAPLKQFTKFALLATPLVSIVPPILAASTPGGVPSWLPSTAKETESKTRWAAADDGVRLGRDAEASSTRVAKARMLEHMEDRSNLTNGLGVSFVP